MKTALLWLGAVAMSLAIAACAAQQQTLQPGMTAGQAVAALGEPDLKDTVAAPGAKGQALLRYTWLKSGQAAVFGPDNRIAQIQQLSPETTQTAAEQPPQPSAPSNFDPIETPLDYAFYPLRAAAIYLGAGLNCLGGGTCQKPKLPSPSDG